MVRSWTVYTDGGSRGNPGPAASAYVVFSETGKLVHEAGRFIGRATNNIAEYTAVADALLWLASTGIRGREPPSKITFKCDSLLVVEQLCGRFKVRHDRIAQMVEKIRRLIVQLPSIRFVHVRRQQNVAADALVNKTLDGVR